MTLLAPMWLLLAVPLAIVFVAWLPATRLLRMLRVLLLAAIVLAMCELAVTWRSGAGTVIIVADRSLSMPQQTDALQQEVVGMVESIRPRDSQIGVVSFGSDARVEVAPAGGRLGSFSMGAVEPESNLQRGLETALSLIPPDTPGTILVLSDGRWTGRDPAAAMLAAADRGVAIDYRVIERPGVGDVAIERIDPPSSVAPGEVFAIHATIDSPAEQDATITLSRGDTRIASGVRRLKIGANRVVFRDRAAHGGVLPYMLNVEAAARDPQPENNVARFLVGVSGPRPALVVSASESSTFADTLTAAGVPAVRADNTQWTLEMLANHSVVVLENVPADRVGADAMRTIASWVTDAGGGLVVTGGRSGFAAGGYFRSPIDPVLPVSMELRREHRKLRMSIVIAMDRSGSMAVSAGGGRTKMDLANLAAAQVLDLLSPQDELGVVAVDSSAHIIADLDPVGPRPDLRQRIMRVQSQGGGIFVFEALSTAARMLITAGTQTRHIILFADAADSEEPGEYRELLAKCAKANITVSVIGLGSERDVDANLLKEIAALGGGRAYFTDDPEQLPRLFAQDTFIVARSAFVDDATAVRPTAALLSMTGRSFAGMPAIGGYNLSYLRDGASSAVVSVDEYKAPILASWQAGLGRAAAFTGEVSGEYTGALGSWNDAATLHSSVVRWAGGAAAALPDHMLVTQRVDKGVARIELQLDPEQSGPGAIAVPEVTTLAARLGAEPAVTKTRMVWSAPDRLTAEVPMSGDFTYISSIEVPSEGRVTLPPVRLPYAAEYGSAEEGEGLRAMQELARGTGGEERIDVANVWRDLARRRQPVVLTTWLIALALGLLLLETLERRTRLLSSFRLPQWSTPYKARRVERPAPPAPTRVAEADSEPLEEPQRQAGEATLLDALSRANLRARRKLH